MKYMLLTLLVSVLSIFNSYSQWRLKKVNTQDLIFNTITVKSRGLKLELKVLDTNTVMYLQGNYFAEANPFVTLDLYTNQGIKSYSFKSIEGYHEDVIILTYDLKKSKIYEDLKQAYAIKVTIYDSIINNSTICLNTENYLNLSNNFSHE